MLILLQFEYSNFKIKEVWRKDSAIYQNFSPIEL